MSQSPIKTARIKRGVSQEYLANITGFTQGYISFLESGKRIPSNDNILTISEALHCTPEELLDGRPLRTIRADIVGEMKCLSQFELEKVLDYVQVLKRGRR